MTESKQQDHGAHRAAPDGLRNKPLMWLALAGVVLVTITTAGILFPRGNGEDDPVGRAEPTLSTSMAEADVPVVVGATATRATTWTNVLADPSVDLGLPAEDAATRSLIARSLHEGLENSELRPALEEAFKKRARTEGDAHPVLDAAQRLKNTAAQAVSPAAARAATVEVDRTTPALTHTVVTRTQWEEWRAKNPDTTLVASTPGGREDQDFQRVDETTLQQSLDQWNRLARPFYALVALDVSGSMAEPALPDGSTRMDLTMRAAEMAITMFPEHDSVGGWVFSRNMVEARDYREIAPITAMDTMDNGLTHRERLLRTAAQLRSTGGDTGLYDTTLAAYRQVLAEDVPGALRTVIVLTDGLDNDPGSIGLENLLRSLREEQDPDNPVRVITVGISDAADARVLQQIAEATGGSSHIAKKPEDIQTAFMRALTES